MKKCTKCGIEKPLSEFHKRKASKDGLAYKCKSCHNAANKRHYRENSEKYSKRRREKSEEKKAYNALYREKHLDRLREYDRLRHAKNRDARNAKNRDYYKRTRPVRIENSRTYRAENKEEVNKRQMLRYRKKNDNQPACIYQIINDKNGKIYIGETLRGELRWKQHLKDLRGGYNANRLLQEDFDSFGEEVFRWEILKEFPKDKKILLLEEARTINKFLKEDKELYNLTLTIEQLKLLQENGE
jgi:predicted GIY-YIG superfamily endonuclease